MDKAIIVAITLLPTQVAMAQEHLVLLLYTRIETVEVDLEK